MLRIVFLFLFFVIYRILLEFITAMVKFCTGGFGYWTFEINLIYHNFADNFTGSTEAQVRGAKDLGSFSARNAWRIEFAIQSVCVSDFAIQSTPDVRA